MIDVLLISRDDWGNVGWLFEQALRTVGVKAKAVKHRPHGFAYPLEAKILALEEITALAQEARCLLLMHSRAAVAGVDFRSKYTVVFHGGSAYRRNPDAVNAVFNPIVQATIIQSGDLLGHGAKNECWIMPPVDTEKIRPARLEFAGAIQFAHYPSKPDVKGSRTINAVMEKLGEDPKLRNKFEYLYSPEKVPWPQQIERMSECDVYIETLSPELQNKAFGEWGLTGMEAAALGRIVISNQLTRELYLKEYAPKCSILPANTAEELEQQVRKVLQMHKQTARKQARSTRHWVEKYHSFEAVGRKLKAVFDPGLC